MPSPDDLRTGAPDGVREAATAAVTPAVSVRGVTHRYGRGADAVT
ncbi:ABC transporter, partial [Streptomyces sp. FT05W]